MDSHMMTTNVSINERRALDFQGKELIAMRTTISVIFLALSLAYIPSVWAAETHVYETQKVALTGTLIEKTFYGPPGYGEDPKHDVKEPVYILKLQRPITAVPDKQDTTNERHDNVTEVQVVNMKQLPLKSFLKKKVTVTGTLFSAITGHHHTQVLISAEEATLSSRGASRSDSPEEIVRRLYKNDFPGSEGLNRSQYGAALSRYFDAGLVELFIKDWECERREPGLCGPDFMILYDAQDSDITDLKVGAFDSRNSTVEVRFKNFGKPVSVVYVMRKTAAGWRISDIRYQSGHSILKLLKAS